MRTPVKEGHPSPIRSPASRSPAHRSRPHTSQGSPGKDQGHDQRSRSPAGKHEKEGNSPLRGKSVEDGNYDDDFEEATHDNVSSLEEEGGSFCVYLIKP